MTHKILGFFYKERENKDSGEQPQKHGCLLEQTLDLENKYMSVERVKRRGEDERRDERLQKLCISSYNEKLPY